MVNRKDRKASGRVRQDGYYDDIENYTGDIVFWDDWMDHRDGFRNWYSDNTKYKAPERHYACWGTSDTEEIERLDNINKRISLLNSIRQAKKTGRVAITIY